MDKQQELQTHLRTVQLQAATEDAVAGKPIARPWCLSSAGDDDLWRLVGVANVAWGHNQRTTLTQTQAFLTGLRETCVSFHPDSGGASAALSTRMCFVLGPE